MICKNPVYRGGIAVDMCGMLNLALALAEIAAEQI